MTDSLIKKKKIKILGLKKNKWPLKIYAFGPQPWNRDVLNKVSRLTCGVPQGSIFGPILCNTNIPIRRSQPALIGYYKWSEM